MSKAGKRFAFVRFIKVDDIARLIGNLCTLWVGRYHLHANVVRYEHPSKPHQTTRFPHYNYHSPPGSYVAVVKDYKSKNNPSNSSLYTPSLMLEDSCSIEGFLEVKLSNLRGMWVLIELVNVATKMKLLQHTRVNSWFNVIQAAKHDFVSDEWVVWVDIEGIPVHGVDLVNDSDEEGVSETLFGDKTSSPRNNAHKGEDYVAVQQPEDPHHPEDPFGVYELLHKKTKGGVVYP
uniref:RNA-directed DNA polymerase, eukaryota, nucleotide-binding alpha-beta plait domain protein n=1 Tax=Tanacetum cinerariifolium TaxID=118510 RepID=A0A6L2LP81_TANCI|nr:hypothetical protein [Tanacetum cinerariifolium]